MLQSVDRPVDRNRESVDRSIDRECAQHAHPQLLEIRSTVRSTVLDCNRYGRCPGRPTKAKNVGQGISEDKINFK